MSEIRASVHGKPRTWIAVSVEDVIVREGSEVKIVVMVRAMIKGAGSAGVQGIFRMDEWRKMQVVKP